MRWVAILPAIGALMFISASVIWGIKGHTLLCTGAAELAVFAFIQSVLTYKDK